MCDMTTYDMTKNRAKSAGSTKRKGTRNSWSFGMKQDEVKDEETKFEMHPEDAAYANGGEICSCCGCLNCEIGSD
jgi:hypothetical protein